MAWCKSLNAFEFLMFRDMVLPCFRAAVGQGLVRGSHFLEGAYLDGRPAGVAVFTAPDGSGKGACHIVTLHVPSLYRGRGVGSCLMDRVIKRAQVLGAAAVHLDFSRSESWAPSMARILHRAGFETQVEFRAYQVRVSASRLAAHLGFMTRLAPGGPGPGADFGFFSNLSKEALSDLKSGAGQWYPREVCPFTGQGQRNADLSLVLTVDDQVAGWVDVRNLDSRTISFNTVFVREEYRGRGLFTRLLAQSLEQLGNLPSITRAVFKTRTDNRVLQAAVDKLVAQFYPITTHIHSYQRCRLSSARARGAAAS